MVNLDSELDLEFFRAVSCNREQKLGKWLMAEMRSTRGCCFFFFFFFFGETIAYLHPAEKGKMAEKKRKLAEAMTLSGVRGDRIWSSSDTASPKTSRQWEGRDTNADANKVSRLWRLKI